MPASSRPRRLAADQLAELLARRPIVHTRTEYGRGETDYVTVYVIRPEPGHPDGLPCITNISWAAGTACGLRLKDGAIALRGGQYNKGLEVADAIWRHVHGEPIPQDTNWREIR